MNKLTIVIEGKTITTGEQPWLKQELQKLLDFHAPFFGSELRVVLAEGYRGGEPPRGAHPQEAIVDEREQ